MTDEQRERMERMERNMEFIVEHQAKFNVDIERINESIDKHREAIDKQHEAIVDLVRVSRTLIDHQMAAEGQMSELRNQMSVLARSQVQTDERLSAFITYVEKYISSHNGH